MGAKKVKVGGGEEVKLWKVEGVVSKRGRNQNRKRKNIKKNIIAIKEMDKGRKRQGRGERRKKTSWKLEKGRREQENK